jgi:hypothetical protein
MRRQLGDLVSQMIELREARRTREHVERVRIMSDSSLSCGDSTPRFRSWRRGGRNGDREVGEGVSRWEIVAPTDLI